MVNSSKENMGSMSIVDCRRRKAEITLVEFGGRYCEIGCGVSSLETKIEIIIIGLY